MPNWNIHLEAGHRLADRLQFSEPQRKEFFLGCLLPDINNGYINHVKVKKRHSETHYAYNQKSSLNFYAENKKQVDQRDPVFLGYLFHLYTDGFFNYDFYHAIKRHPLGQGLEHDAKCAIKHHDFWLYDSTLHHCLGIQASDDIAALVDHANQIPAVDIVPDDIVDVERILVGETLNASLQGDSYQFYTEQYLATLLDRMIESFTGNYLA